MRKNTAAMILACSKRERVLAEQRKVEEAAKAAADAERREAERKEAEKRVEIERAEAEKKAAEKAALAEKLAAARGGARPGASERSKSPTEKKVRGCWGLSPPPSPPALSCVAAGA